ncbi:MAG: tRNA (adenosine(37)-N6)-threonylcarbamoyltransferase complex dimerization subunit type 1 TsaB, partial [Candidatus Pacebacteria bacterium]|nr:tRNA (adenosine(37)-N6)-threonylcarbamoyltransferase complex dimerization subunit type 1 TsaB [Candidatus Paceibacterota bacterium]
MISAALDSSFGIALAVAENDRLVVEANRPFQGRRNDENLVPWIREALANAELNLSSIVRWNVGRGPGSFTGIRVGIAFVKGVCMQTGAAYRGVPSSLALACAASNELNVGDHIAVVHDARRGQLIATHYKVCDEGMVDEQTPASVINPEN